MRVSKVVFRLFCSFFFSYHCKLLRQSKKETGSENILGLCPSEQELNIKIQVMKTNQQSYHGLPCTPGKMQELGRMSRGMYVHTVGRRAAVSQVRTKTGDSSLRTPGAALPLASPLPTCSDFLAIAQLRSNIHTPQRTFNGKITPNMSCARCKCSPGTRN